MKLTLDTFLSVINKIEDQQEHAERSDAYAEEHHVTTEDNTHLDVLTVGLYHQRYEDWDHIDLNEKDREEEYQDGFSLYPSDVEKIGKILDEMTSWAEDKKYEILSVNIFEIKGNNFLEFEVDRGKYIDTWEYSLKKYK